jgi:hypothetical protein
LAKPYCANLSLAALSITCSFSFVLSNISIFD